MAVYLAVLDFVAGAHVHRRELSMLSVRDELPLVVSLSAADILHLGVEDLARAYRHWILQVLCVALP